MKSIMEEASSIAKAIEQAWLRAGQPEEFTVKVFEEPKKNFFGLTTQPAKIALLFSEQAVRKQPHPVANPQPQQPKPEHPAQVREPRPQQRRDRGQQPQRRGRPDEQRDHRQEQPPRQQQHVQRHPQRHEEQSRPAPYQQAQATPAQDSPWTQDVVNAARDWVQETLNMTNKRDVTFTMNVNRNYLNIRFNSAIVPGEDQEVLFKSWSNLLSQSLRDTFKQDLRSIRISFSSNR